MTSKSLTTLRPRTPTEPLPSVIEVDLQLIVRFINENATPQQRAYLDRAVGTLWWLMRQAQKEK